MNTEKKTSKFCALIRAAVSLLKGQLFLENAVARPYQRITKDNMAVVTATIHFTRLSHYTDLFRVKLKVTERIDENDTTILRHTVDEWLCSYSLSLRQLIELGGARRIAFIPEEGKLYLEADEYIG